VRDTVRVSACESLSEEQYARWVREEGFGELRQVLFWRWDPVGVEDAFPITADEYDDYARVLMSRLRKGAGEPQVAAYLLSVEREWMGRRFSDDAKLEALGERILDWFEESLSLWMERSDEFH